METFFHDLDFRRFQVELDGPYPMDEPEKIPALTEFGNQLGEMIIADQMDGALGIKPKKAPLPGPVY